MEYTTFDQSLMDTIWDIPKTKACIKKRLYGLINIKKNKKLDKYI